MADDAVAEEAVADDADALEPAPEAAEADALPADEPTEEDSEALEVGESETVAAEETDGAVEPAPAEETAEEPAS